MQNIKVNQIMQTININQFIQTIKLNQVMQTKTFLHDHKSVAVVLWYVSVVFVIHISEY
jgi:hypothetical protein